MDTTVHQREWCDARRRSYSAAPVSSRTGLRTGAGLTTGVALTVVALYASKGRLGDAVKNLGHVRPVWLGVALVTELASMAAFARMQRRLLIAGGTPVSVPAALAVTYAGNAVAMTLPVAGSATGTRFTFKRWVQHGADPAVAAWVLLMAGIFSTSALAIIGGIGGLVAGNIATGIVGAALTLVGIAPFVVVLVALRDARWRRDLVNASAPLVGRVLAIRGRDRATARASVENFFGRVAAVRIGHRTGLGVAAFALLNWLADIGCLAACLAAFGATVPWTRLILLYLAGIGAATFTLTPAGIGVVEVAVAATATSLGIGKADAMASALLYRGISSWLVISAGWVIFVALRRAPTPGGAEGT
jgi:putative heme transporter